MQLTKRIPTEANLGRGKRKHQGLREEGKGGTFVSSITAQRIPVFSIAARRLSKVSWW